MQRKVTVIGAGLAGSEAAWQLAERGFLVTLFEMRPKVKSPAHHTGYFAELVCSNSLRSNALNQAVGILKEELRLLNSLIISMADHYRVPAGSALAVDREGFSQGVSDALKNHPNIKVVNEEVKSLPDGPCIICTGPLSADSLLKELTEVLGRDLLYFYDAAAPIIDYDSIDMSICYKKSRYDKGTEDYINCPMTKAEYDHFILELIQGECVRIKSFELKVFESCMPLEVMARRGKDTLLYGPLKPVGLQRIGEQPYAVVQLRQDDIRASMYNMVGFQTHLTHPEQKRIFRQIPGLEKAEFLRYGVMHRNTFLRSPGILNANYRVKGEKPLYISGQLTGVEGYTESASSGLVAALALARELTGKSALMFPKETMTGALADYVAHANKEGFQPMHVNFGLVPPLKEKHYTRERKTKIGERALNKMREVWEGYDDE